MAEPVGYLVPVGKGIEQEYIYISTPPPSPPSSPITSPIPYISSPIISPSYQSITSGDGGRSSSPPINSPRTTDDHGNPISGYKDANATAADDFHAQQAAKRAALYERNHSTPSPESIPVSPIQTPTPSPRNYMPSDDYFRKHRPIPAVEALPISTEPPSSVISPPSLFPQGAISPIQNAIIAEPSVPRMIIPTPSSISFNPPPQLMSPSLSPSFMSGIPTRLPTQTPTELSKLNMPNYPAQPGSIAAFNAELNRNPILGVATFLASPDVMIKTVSNAFYETIGKTIMNLPPSNNPAAMVNVLRDVGFNPTQNDLLNSRTDLRREQINTLLNVESYKQQYGQAEGVTRMVVENPVVQTAAMMIPAGMALEGVSLGLKGLGYGLAEKGLGGQIVSSALYGLEKVITNPYVQLGYFGYPIAKDIVGSKNFGEGLGKAFVAGVSLPGAATGFKMGENLAIKGEMGLGVIRAKTYLFTGEDKFPLMSGGEQWDILLNQPTISGVSVRTFPEKGYVRPKVAVHEESLGKAGTFMTIGRPEIEVGSSYFVEKSNEAIQPGIINKLKYELNRAFTQPQVELIKDVKTIGQFLPEGLKTNIRESVKATGKATQYQAEVYDIAEAQSKLLNQPIAVPSPKRFAGETHHESEAYLIYGNKEAQKITNVGWKGFTEQYRVPVREIRLGELPKDLVAPKNNNVLEENLKYNLTKTKNYVKGMSWDANRKLGESSGNLLSIPGEYGLHGASHASEVIGNVMGFKTTNVKLNEFTNKDIIDAGMLHDIAKISEGETQPLSHAKASAMMLEMGLIKGVSPSKASIKAISEHTDIQPVSAILSHPVQAIKTLFKHPSELSKALATSDRMTLKTRFGTEVNPAQLFNMNVFENKKSISAMWIDESASMGVKKLNQINEKMPEYPLNYKPEKYLEINRGGYILKSMYDGIPKGTSGYISSKQVDYGFGKSSEYTPSKVSENKQISDYTPSAAKRDSYYPSIPTDSRYTPATYTLNDSGYSLPAYKHPTESGYSVPTYKPPTYSGYTPPYPSNPPNGYEQPYQPPNYPTPDYKPDYKPEYKSSPYTPEYKPPPYTPSTYTSSNPPYQPPYEPPNYPPYQPPYQPPYTPGIDKTIEKTPRYLIPKMDNEYKKKSGKKYRDSGWHITNQLPTFKSLFGRMPRP